VLELIRSKLENRSITSGTNETVLFDPDADNYRGPAILYIPAYQSSGLGWTMETLGFNYDQPTQDGMRARIKMLWQDAMPKLKTYIERKEKEEKERKY